MAEPASAGPGVGSLVARLVCAVLLIAALLPFPYAYYVLVRWVACPVLIHTAIVAHRQRREGWTWVFGVTAAMLNPIFPLHLGRGGWIPVDLAVAVFLLVSLWTLRQARAGPHPP